MNNEENRILEFDAVILQNGSMDAAYVEVPYDIKALFGKGRLLVHASFDGVPYDGQIVKMGTPCYIIGVRKDIRKQIGKSFGDIVHVTFVNGIKNSRGDRSESYPSTCPSDYRDELGKRLVNAAK